MTPEEARRAAAEHPLWYHTIDLGHGTVTSGVFDLRPIVGRMPWPDVRGKRCLDVGTYDGFLAFELERRGASEVVAVDIDDHTLWDWPYEMRVKGPEFLAQIAGPEKGAGFRIAKAALGSSVERMPVSVYDLDPGALGSFDVVVCGSLMLHLRDPVRALEAIRRVCGGAFLSAECIDLPLTAVAPRRPLVRLGPGHEVHWWVPSAAAHRRMLEAAGFAIDRTTRPYVVGYGSAHLRRSRAPRQVARDLLQRVLAGGVGVPHAAALCRPA